MSIKLVRRTKPTFQDEYKIKTETLTEDAKSVKSSERDTASPVKSVEVKSVRPQSIPITKEESSTWYLFHQVSQVNEISRVLLYGKPGTGKTTQACKVSENGFYSIPLNEETTVSEVLGFWLPKGDGFEWMNGTAVRAWLEEKVLVLNEIDHASGSVMSILHSILDDKEMACISLPNGQNVRPGKRFRVIATMNGGLGDLPVPLLDRFDIKIQIDEPHPNAIKSLEPDLQELVKSAYSNDKKLNISFREIVAFSKLRKFIGDDAYAVFGTLASDVRTIMKIGKRGE